MSKRGVFFDLVAAQSPSYRGRGIDRYSTELVRAMVKGHPDLVAGVVLHPELPLPGDMEDIADWVTMEPRWQEGSVLHMSSVFEPEVPVRVFWPREAAAHRVLTAVTLYDLIPEVFPGWYLEDPGLRRRWRCCREVVRVADAVFAPSQSAKEDAVALLGVPEGRVTVIGSGTAPAFRRPESVQAALEVAQAGVAGLEEGFVLYTGAFNPRKNVDRLVQGYAALPRGLVDRHQLVIACEAPPLTRNHYLVMARELGVEGRLLIPGFVPEQVLVALNQSARLAVFPSLYEGYGLPVIEAMACGTPAIAGDNSSLREILPREARFAPEDPGAIAQALAKGLTDEALRHRLASVVDREPPSWSEVADRAAVAFEQLLRRASDRRPGWRRRPQLALVGVPGPLAGALAELAQCDRFTREAHRAADVAGEAVSELSATALRRLDAWRGGYDAVVSWLDCDALEGAAVGLGPEAGGESPGPESPGATGLGGLEELVPEWPGRATVVVAASSLLHEKAIISRLEALGAKVVRAGESWAETARLVVEGLPGVK
jgi:glycosyltransferase involved in cell wall biosynthesis